MKRTRHWIGCAMLTALMGVIPAANGLEPRRVTLGSKAFPESWILGEALAALARNAGADAAHRSNLGGTEIVYGALRSGAIDAYPEYTGTIAEVLVKASGRPTLEELRSALAPNGVGVSDPLGFNDGYALAVTRTTAERLSLRRLSDLATHRELRFGLTHEFIGRKDGFPGLAAAYRLDGADVRGIQHELAYEALASGKVDVIDIYTTDAQIEAMGLVTLEDDRAFFPRYDAVVLYRLDLADRAPELLAAMLTLVGHVDEATMTRANARVVLGQQSFQAAAAGLLDEAIGERGGEGSSAGEGGGVARSPGAASGAVARIAGHTVEHLRLVAISLAAAILIGMPLGVLATRAPWLATLTLSGAGLMQTIPSLALLAFLIPLLGIGAGPALVALFLYSLLPIVRNTYTGIVTIPPALIESAEALALSAPTRLWRVTLPMASPAIMAGIKTSAVINVGTATLAALIGAGGLGDPILSGIQLRRSDLILQGAIPAAVLALLVQWGFDRLDRVVVPRALRANGVRKAT